MFLCKGDVTNTGSANFKMPLGKSSNGTAVLAYKKQML